MTGLELFVSTRVASEVALVVFAKASVLLLVAALVVYGLRPRSASVRHLVWTTALLSLLLIPLVQVAGPGWLTVERDVWHYPAETALVGLESVETSAPPVLGSAPSDPSGTAPLATSEGATDSDRGAAPLPPATVLLLVWWIGVVALGTGWAVDLATAAEVARRGTLAFASDPVAALIDRERRRLGMSRTVALVRSAERGLAATVGVWRPAIVLGPDVAAMPIEELRPVVLHELAHVRRHDVLTHVLTRAAVCLTWPNPLAWWSLRCAAEERERACDDAVLRHGVRSPDYARVLLAFALTGFAVRPALRSSVGLRLSTTRRRFDSILDGRVDRRPGRRRVTVLVASAFVALGVAVGSLDVLAAVPGTGSTDDLIAALRHPEPAVRVRAAHTLGRRGAAPARKDLERLLDDPCADVRLAAIGALEMVADPASLEAMAHVLERPFDGGRGEHGFVLKLAMRTLGKMDSSTARRILEDQLDRPVEQLRWLALETILSMPSQRDAAAPYLRSFATSDPSERVRRLATEALGSFH